LIGIATSGWRVRGVLLGLLALAGAAELQAAEDLSKYPSRPIRVIAPFAPGGASDFAIRLLQNSLTQSLGQQIIIDNRTGAAGNIGMEAAARSTNDGYTLFFGNVGTISINPHFYPDLSVSPERDFIPISIAAETPGILVASPKFPPNTVKEMVEYVKANPGKVNYASAGISTLNRLEMEVFRKTTSLDMTHVPYRGGAGPAVGDLLAGHVQVMFVTISSAAEHVKSGALKAYAVTTKERVPSLPNVPTMLEQGYPDNVSTSWQGLFALAGTPQPIVDKLHAAVMQAMTDTNARKLMMDNGMLPTVSKTPDEFKKYLAAESEKWKRVVQHVGTKPN
jgi:tripartite-type tricarboxylate transporter receptor subunit TctC